ncbi:MAG: SET domain-containing protein-lysine N-methyltransferase [Patescibacteria group bacterium]
MSDVIVKKSKISGRGVFAAREYKKGEVILRWNLNRIVSKQQRNNLSTWQKEHTICLGRGKYAILRSPERFINHSCDPNTHVKNFCDVAVKKIRKGEEITGNYFQEYSTIKGMKCKCGSKNCRSVV